MGIAAYNRGSAHLSRQLDRDLADRKRRSDAARIVRETIELEELADHYAVAFRKLRDAGDVPGYLALKLHGLEIRRRATLRRQMCGQLGIDVDPAPWSGLAAYYAAGGRS